MLLHRQCLLCTVANSQRYKYAFFSFFWNCFPRNVYAYYKIDGLYNVLSRAKYSIYNRRLLYQLTKQFIAIILLRECNRVLRYIRAEQSISGKINKTVYIAQGRLRFQVLYIYTYMLQTTTAIANLQPAEKCCLQLCGRFFSRRLFALNTLQNYMCSKNCFKY